MIRSFLLALLLAAPVVGQEFRTISDQFDTDNVSITGGSIDGVTLGATSVTLSSNVALYGDSADVLTLRNGATGQLVRVYNIDSGSDDEYAAIGWSSNELLFSSVATGTGDVRQVKINGDNILLQDEGTTKLSVTSSSVNVGGNFRGLTDNSYDLGTSSFAWKDLYFDGVAYLGSGTELVGNGDGGLIVRNAADTARLTVDASGNATTVGSLSVGGNATLYGEAANTLAQRNSTNAQSYRLYSTYTDASNYERLESVYTGGQWYLRSVAAGTGTQQRVDIDGSLIYLRAGGTAKLGVTSTSVNSGATFRGLVDASYDLGTSAVRWRDAYYSGTVNAGIVGLAEQSSDPSDPAEGRSVVWQSDGTGSGDDGDIMVKITAGGVTKTVTLIDFSTF